MSSSDKENNNVTSFDSDATYCSEYESRIQLNNQIEQTTRKIRNHLSLAKPLKRLKSKKSNKCSKIFSRIIPSIMLQRVEKRMEAHFNGSHLMSSSEILELLGGLHKLNFDVFQDYKTNLINRLDKLYKLNRILEEMESKINDPMENISIPEVMQYESGHVNAEMIRIPDNITDNTVGTEDLQFLSNQDFESDLDDESNSKIFVTNNPTGQSNEDNATGFRNSEKANVEKTDTDLDIFSRSENQHISDSHDSDNDSAPPKKKIFKIDGESDVGSNGYSVKNASPETNELAKKIFKLDGESEGSSGYPVKNASPESIELAKIFEQILHIDRQYSKNVDSVDNVKNEDETAAKKIPFEEVEAVKNSFIKTHNRTMDKLCSDITTGKSNWEQTYDVFNDITNIFAEGNELLSKIWSNLEDTSLTEQLNIEEIVKYHVETFGPECADDIRDLLNSNLKRMEEIAEEFKNDPQVRELFDAQEKTSPEDFGLVDWRKIAQLL